MFRVKQLMLFIGLSVMFAVPLSVMVSQLITPPQRIVTMDLNGAVKRYSQHLANNPTKQPDTLIDRSIEQYSGYLESELSIYAKEHHATILVQGAVVKGPSDITAYIETRVIERMTQKLQP